MSRRLAISMILSWLVWGAATVLVVAEHLGGAS